MSAQDNMKLARMIYGLFDQHQLDKADAYASEDAVITLVPPVRCLMARKALCNS